MLAASWMELVACSLTLLAIAAKIGTLYPYQDKPLPQWPLAITINALLSIYMTVLKAATGYLLAQGISLQKCQWFSQDTRPLYDLALYDATRRGPLGAILLLKRLSIHRICNWTGCLLVLAALLVDPFTQQVLHYVDCETLSPAESASIPMSNVFYGGGQDRGAGYMSIASGEQAAVQADIGAPGGQVTYQCPSGNCTFSSFGSVGYCIECTDTSDMISFKVQNSTFAGHGMNASVPGLNTSLPGLSNYFVVDPLNSSAPTQFATLGYDDGRESWQFIVRQPMIRHIDSSAPENTNRPGPYGSVTDAPP